MLIVFICFVVLMSVGLLSSWFYDENAPTHKIVRAHIAFYTFMIITNVWSVGMVLEKKLDLMQKQIQNVLQAEAYQVQQTATQPSTQPSR